MYRNFICYRGGSSAGVFIADELFLVLNKEKASVGETYYSLTKNDYREIRNFLTDPGKYLGNVENFIMMLTKDFFEGFIENGVANANSVTRIEIDEVLKNSAVRFIPVVFPDFSWEAETGGRKNKEILRFLWGEDAMQRIVGSPPVPFIMQFKANVYQLILDEIKQVNIRKKVVVFDFDGTMTKPTDTANAWESLWMVLGYPLSECERYHRLFSKKQISHSEWCEITEKKFKEAGCTREHLKKAAESLELVDDTKEVIFELKAQGILLYILSGSIKQCIEYLLGKELTSCFTEIKANRLVFNSQGNLDGIIGTPYDFERKADFVNKIISQKNINPHEILYVGNSFNDEFVYLTGAETLCINPRNTDFYDDKIWHNYIRKLTSMRQILPYVYNKE